jgi:hypothetical protein
VKYHIGGSLVEWDDALMVHGWPECGAGSMDIEKLYQAFKARMAEEMRHAQDCPCRTDLIRGECDCGRNEP